MSVPNLVIVPQQMLDEIFSKLERIEKSVQKGASSEASGSGEKFLTRKQAMEKLKCSNVTLWRWTLDGVINSVKVGGKVLYKESELDALAERK